MLSYLVAKLELFALILLISNKNMVLSQYLNNSEVSSISTDIQNHQFTAANDKLSSTKQYNELTVSSVIHDVYLNDKNNTKTIIDFAHYVPEAFLSFQILQQLKIELTSNNRTDPLQLITLYRALEDDVIFKNGGEPLFNNAITRLVNEIKANVAESATEILKNAMFDNDFERNDYIQNVTNGLFNFYYEISDQVMQALVNETYPKVPATQLTENIMFGSNYLPQKLVFFLALYDKLKANGDLNNEAVLKIAYFVRILKKWNKYKNAFQPLKYAINEMIRKMPTCARNIYFGEDICIWNRGRDEYLYAAASQHHLSRRGIFTYRAVDLTRQGIWKTEFYGDDVYFKSRPYPKEYLYASTTDKYNSSARHVLTWVDDGFVGDTSAWKIELDGDFCFIRNVNFKEYLYTSDKFQDVKKRYVLTVMKTSKPEDNQDFQWQIRNCK